MQYSISRRYIVRILHVTMPCYVVDLQWHNWARCCCELLTMEYNGVQHGTEPQQHWITWKGPIQPCYEFNGDTVGLHWIADDSWCNTTAWLHIPSFLDCQLCLILFFQDLREVFSILSLEKHKVPDSVGSLSTGSAAASELSCIWKPHISVIGVATRLQGVVIRA